MKGMCKGEIAMPQIKADLGFNIATEISKSLLWKVTLSYGFIWLLYGLILFFTLWELNIATENCQLYYIVFFPVK